MPVGVALLLGLLARATGARPARRSRIIEVLGGLFVAAILLIVATRVYAPLHLKGGDYLYSDFADYCSMVHAFSSDIAPADSSRSVLLARVVGWLTPAGRVFDGMVWGAWVGAFGVIVGVMAWARCLGGRLAGLVAGVVFLGVGPLVLLTRTPTFYPLMNAAFVLGAAATCWALLRGSVVAVGVSGVMVGVVAMADTRGIAWATVYAGLSLIAAMWGPPLAGPAAPRPTWGRRLGEAGVRVLVLGLVIAGMWAAGRQVQTPAQCAPVVRQVRSFLGAMLDTPTQADPRARTPIAVCDTAGEYCWGWSDPQRIPATLRCSSALVDLLPDDLESDRPSITQGRRAHLSPWVWLVPVLLGLVVLRNVRRPRQLWMLLTLVPFGSGLELAAFVEPDFRRLVPVLLPVPVLAGLATAALYRLAAGGSSVGTVERLHVAGRGGAIPPPQPSPAAATTGGGSLNGAGRPVYLARALGVGITGLVVGVWLLAVSGRVDGWWAPRAAWRAPFSANGEHLGLRAGVSSGGAGSARCSAALREGPADLGVEAVWARALGQAHE